MPAALSPVQRPLGKMMSKTISRGFGEPIKEYGLPVFFDLHTDPKEEHPLDPRWIENGWVRWPTGQLLVEHVASLKKDPPASPATTNKGGRAAAGN